MSTPCIVLQIIDKRNSCEVFEATGLKYRVSMHFQTLRMSESIPIISLFSGSGGMDIGFESAGFSVVFAADYEADSVRTFNANRARAFAHQIDLADTTPATLVAKIHAEIGDIIPRGVIGGPPCQAFSLANVNKKKRDRRKMLILRYAEHIKALNAKYDLDFVVFENVPGLRAKNNSRYLTRFKASLRKAGFILWERELNAKYHGVAQNRRRVFVVGINRRRFGDIAFRFPPKLDKIQTVRDLLAGLPEPAFCSFGLDVKNIPKHPNHWTMKPRSKKLSNFAKQTGRSFRRLQWDKPSWTVAYGNREIHLHPDSKRRLSIYEAMLLQGFPSKYRLYGTFSSQVQQISNAVPPPLARAVAGAIADLLYFKAKRIRLLLAKWGKPNRRDFPWRHNRTPYNVMVAEKLLQQTRATPKVVSIYNEFIQTYPTLTALGQARIEDISHMLRPLGFSYRAKELIELANAINDYHHGIIPSDLKALQALPGIGDYSARAIQCFGFGSGAPIVDANIGRLLGRLYDLKKTYANPARSSTLLNLAIKLIPEQETADFNFALLDFCAAVCKATKPLCLSCPLKKECDHATSEPVSSRVA
jgi:DNA (cytosine-5)-methyltransferase 1